MQTMINQMLQNNPLYKRAQEMANGKNEKELEQIASNLCMQRGIDLKTAYTQFQNQFQQIQNMFGINR